MNDEEQQIASAYLLYSAQDEVLQLRVALDQLAAILNRVSSAVALGYRGANLPEDLVAALNEGRDIINALQ